MRDPENLPTIITKPGRYLTRSGREVVIDEIKTPRKATNNCHGWSKRLTPTGRIEWDWDIWSPQGRFRFIGEHPLDIIRPLT